MRFLQGVLLLAIVGVVVAFGLQNNELISVELFGWAIKAPISVIVAVAYALGMLTGWTVLAFVRKSIQNVVARRQVEV